MEFIHGILRGSGQQYSFRRGIDESTGGSNFFPTRMDHTSRYLIVIDPTGFAGRNGLSRGATIIKRDLQAQHYIQFMLFLYKLALESEEIHNGNMWEQYTGIDPVYEIPFYPRDRVDE